MDELISVLEELNKFLAGFRKELHEKSVQKEDEMNIPESIEDVVPCLAKLLNLSCNSTEMLLKYLNSIYDRLVFDVLNRAMAIEMDKQYEDSIKDYVSKDNTFYTIDPMDMEICENKQSELSHVYFSMEAIYRTEDDCDYALDILKNFRKLSCLTKK